MNKAIVLAGLLSLGCALPHPAGETVPVPIAVRSLNRSSVDVYLMCGDRQAQWLGVVHGKETALFDVPALRSPCARGFNFFLHPRDFNRGYWVGPFRMRGGRAVHLTIEKYAGLSAARVSHHLD